MYFLLTNNLKLFLCAIITDWPFPDTWYTREMVGSAATRAVKTCRVLKISKPLEND